MQAHPFDALTLQQGGTVIFTPCPGTKSESLPASVTTLRNAGVDMLLTLMHDEEMEKHNVKALPTECHNQGIKWLQLPILDDAAPSTAFESAWQAYKDDIRTVLQNKGTVAVHCKGGSGRTGLVIGLIMLSLGYSGDDVMKQVQTVRPNALKNSQQLNYFKTYL